MYADAAAPVGASGGAGGISADADGIVAPPRRRKADGWCGAAQRAAGGAGTGILIYRELQRIGIAFTAGILYENDCDYPIAKALAADIVTEKMFEPIGKETLDKACKRIDEADYVIDTGCPIGSINSAMKELLDYAEKKNKRILTKPDIDTMKSLF